MFFFFTVCKPMLMFVVYTSRVKGKALLAPNELSAERAASVPAAEDAASLEGGGVARAAAVAGRGRFIVKPLQPNKQLQLYI